MILPTPSRLAGTLLLPLALAWSAAGSAADLFVLDATIERPEGPTLAPTFMATPGERALLVLDGERPVDVAMTVRPADGGDGAAGSFDLRIELIEGGRVLEDTVRTDLAGPATVTLGDTDITVRARELPGLQQGPDALEPASGNAGRDASGAGATVGAGATGTAGPAEAGPTEAGADAPAATD